MFFINLIYIKIVTDKNQEIIKEQIIQAILKQQVQKADAEKNHGLGDEEWHLFDEPELFAKLQTSRKGLNTTEHERRLGVYGKQGVVFLVTGIFK